MTRKWILCGLMFSATAFAGYKTIEKQVWTPDYCWRVIDKYGTTKCCESEPPTCLGVDCGIDPNWGRSHLQCEVAGASFLTGGVYSLPMSFTLVDAGVDPVPKIECMHPDGEWGKCR